MQLQADILGVPVVRPVIAETTALGAAYAAGLATGFWKDPEDLRQNWKADRRWDPRWTEDQRQTTYRGWRGRRADVELGRCGVRRDADRADRTIAGFTNVGDDRPRRRRGLMGDRRDQHGPDRGCPR